MLVFLALGIETRRPCAGSFKPLRSSDQIAVAATLIVTIILILNPNIARWPHPSMAVVLNARGFVKPFREDLIVPIDPSTWALSRRFALIFFRDRPRSFAPGCDTDILYAHFLGKANIKRAVATSIVSKKSWVLGRIIPCE